jgi:hypothetical protein
MINQEKKSVHVKVSNTVHIELRSLAIKRGVTVQEILEYICGMIVSNDPRTQRILNEIVTKKIDSEINQYTQQLEEKLDIQNSDAIYDFLESKSALNKREENDEKDI